MNQHISALRNAVSELRECARARATNFDRARHLIRRYGPALQTALDDLDKALTHLWPPECPEAPWDSDTIENVADALARYRPKPFNAFNGTGDDPAILVPLFLASWEDNSSPNDACAQAFLPLDESGTVGLIMWVDFDEPSRREIDDHPKFILALALDGEETILFQSEHERDAAKAVACVLTEARSNLPVVRTALRDALRSRH